MPLRLGGYHFAHKINAEPRLDFKTNYPMYTRSYYKNLLVNHTNYSFNQNNVFFTHPYSHKCRYEHQTSHVNDNQRVSKSDKVLFSISIVISLLLLLIMVDNSDENKKEYLAHVNKLLLLTAYQVFKHLILFGDYNAAVTSIDEQLSLYDSPDLHLFKCLLLLIKGAPVEGNYGENRLATVLEGLAKFIRGGVPYENLQNVLSYIENNSGKLTLHDNYIIKMFIALQLDNAAQFSRLLVEYVHLFEKHWLAPIVLLVLSKKNLNLSDIEKLNLPDHMKSGLYLACSYVTEERMEIKNLLVKTIQLSKKNIILNRCYYYIHQTLLTYSNDLNFLALSSDIGSLDDKINSSIRIHSLLIFTAFFLNPYGGSSIDKVDDMIRLFSYSNEKGDKLKLGAQIIKLCILTANYSTLAIKQFDLIADNLLDRVLPKGYLPIIQSVIETTLIKFKFDIKPSKEDYLRLYKHLPTKDVIKSLMKALIVNWCEDQKLADKYLEEAVKKMPANAHYAKSLIYLLKAGLSKNTQYLTQVEATLPDQSIWKIIPYAIETYLIYLNNPHNVESYLVKKYKEITNINLRIGLHFLEVLFFTDQKHDQKMINSMQNITNCINNKDFDPLLSLITTMFLQNIDEIKAYNFAKSHFDKKCFSFIQNRIDPREEKIELSYILGNIGIWLYLASKVENLYSKKQLIALVETGLDYCTAHKETFQYTNILSHIAKNSFIFDQLVSRIRYKGYINKLNFYLANQDYQNLNELLMILSDDANFMINEGDTFSYFKVVAMAKFESPDVALKYIATTNGSLSQFDALFLSTAIQHAKGDHKNALDFINIISLLKYPIKPVLLLKISILLALFDETSDDSLLSEVKKITESAVSTYKADSQLRLARGIVYYKIREFERAAADFDYAAQNGVPLADIYKKYAAINLSVLNGEYEKALLEIDSIDKLATTDLNSKWFNMLKTSITILLEAKKYQTLPKEVTDSFESNDIEAIKNTITNNIQFINYKDKDGNSPLALAILKKQNQVANYLLSLKETNIFTVNNNGQTPLDVAISHKNFDMAALLIEKCNLNNESMHSILKLSLESSEKKFSGAKTIISGDDFLQILTHSTDLIQANLKDILKNCHNGFEFGTLWFSHKLRKAKLMGLMDDNWDPRGYLPLSIGSCIYLYLKSDLKNIEKQTLENEILHQAKSIILYKELKAIGDVRDTNIRDTLLSKHVDKLLHMIAEGKEGPIFTYVAGYPKHYLYVDVSRIKDTVYIRLDNLLIDTIQNHSYEVDKTNHKKKLYKPCIINEFSHQEFLQNPKLKSIIEQYLRTISKTRLANEIDSFFVPLNRRIKSYYPNKIYTNRCSSLEQHPVFDVQPNDRQVCVTLNFDIGRQIRLGRLLHEKLDLLERNLAEEFQYKGNLPPNSIQPLQRASFWYQTALKGIGISMESMANTMRVPKPI